MKKYYKDKNEYNKTEENLSLEDRINSSIEELKKNNELFEYGRMIYEINKSPVRIEYEKISDIYQKYFNIKKRFEYEIEKLKNPDKKIKNKLNKFKRQFKEYNKKIVTAITAIYNNANDPYLKFLMYSQLVKICVFGDEKEFYPLLLNYSFEMQNLIDTLKTNSKKNKKIKNKLNKIIGFAENFI
ncbi:MAG: hypothetical protein ACP5H9_01975 [Candidatus Woesearchaeota archaeon]